MAERNTIPGSFAQPAGLGADALSPLAERYTRKLSDTLALGLLIYTALQIFVMMPVVSGDGGSLLPMLALVILVAGVIPLYRGIERGWERKARALDDSPEQLLAASIRLRRIVWAISLGLPLALTAALRLAVHLIGG